MFATPPIFAFGFANLPMLGWLAAAAAPILIHLWSRQKYRETSWAAMEYLLAALKRQTRRLKFEQWLLLAIRMLIVILVVLAVAEPHLERAWFAGSSSGPTHRVLVIDGSYSMAYKPKDTSRFEQAKELARRIVEESRPGDALTLVLMSSPPRVVVGNPVFEPRDFLQEIGDLRLPHTTADLPATLAKVENILQAARREHQRLTAEEIYFLTDLGRVGWLPEVGEATLAEFRNRAARLAESAAVVLIDLGQPAAENVALTALRPLEPVATPAEDVKLEAVVKNFGRRARTGQPVELLVDGRSVKQQKVDLSPGEEAALSFSYRFDAPGDHTVEVRSVGDGLDVDNHRWLVIPVRRSVRVLCINGRPSGEPFRGAADYLAVALSPQAGRVERALVEVEVAPESALLERGPEQYDCVFLCDVAQFTSNEARVLDSYLKNGGNLVFFLGPQVMAERYNRELGGRAGGVRVLPALLVPGETEPQYRLNPLEYRHPMIQAFMGQQRAGLLTTPIRKYFKLSLPENTKAKVVLQTLGGDPLIVEETIRRGRVVLVATSADASWTPMPMSPGFVPLVQELVSWCVGGELQQRNVEVGQSLAASVLAPAGDVPLVVRRPDGGDRKVRLHSDGDYGALSYAETTISGIYTARYGPPISRTQRFAVNVDTAESDLTQLGEEQLREVWPGIALLDQSTWQSAHGQPAGPAGPITRAGHLHVGLLYLALGLLFLETFLAWRFGHYAT